LLTGIISFVERKQCIDIGIPLFSTVFLLLLFNVEFRLLKDNLKLKHRKMKRILISLIAIVTSAVLFSQPLQRVSPEKAGMDPNRLVRVDNIINSSIEKGEIPGAVLAVVRDGKMAYIKSYGNKALYPKIEKMEVNTIFDMASVSKPVGTAISIMQLVEQGKLRLSDNVAMYIEGFKGYLDTETGKSIDIRIVDLLTHTSGLPPYAPAAELVAKYGSPSPQGLIEYIAKGTFVRQQSFSIAVSIL